MSLHPPSPGIIGSIGFTAISRSLLMKKSLLSIPLIFVPSLSAPLQAWPKDQKGSFPPNRLAEGDDHSGPGGEKEPPVLTGKNSLYIKMERVR